MVTRQLQIYGRVQGVGFRFFLQRYAQKRCVTGWVRNRRDGSVEAVVQGSESEVEAVITWARRGSREAVVERVDVTDAEGAFANFEIRPTL